MLDKARQLAALIEVTSPSPSGVIAASSKGSAQRLARAAAAESAGKATEAAYWYRLAAVDGEPKAFTNLGTLLVRGQGGDKPNPDAARLLWQVAAARGEPIAMYDLGALYEHGIGVAADIPTAKEWYARAAGLGHPQARLALKRLSG